MNTQIPKPRTASQYCWLFAAGCIRDDSLLKEGKVTQPVLETLREVMRKKEYPQEQLILETFKRPFWTLREKGWPLEPQYMLWYWIDVHRSKYEKSPTDFVMIAQNTRGSDFIVPAYTQNGVVIELENVHGFSLESNDLVYAHAGIIALPCKWT